MVYPTRQFRGFNEINVKCSWQDLAKGSIRTVIFIILTNEPLNVFTSKMRRKNHVTRIKTDSVFVNHKTLCASRERMPLFWRESCNVWAIPVFWLHQTEKVIYILISWLTLLGVCEAGVKKLEVLSSQGGCSPKAWWGFTSQENAHDVSRLRWWHANFGQVQ